jgi:hypothetical protein
MKLCPKCGKPNNCALEAGKTISACWCIVREIPEELLSDCNDCICEKCVDEFNFLETMGLTAFCEREKEN